LKPWGSAVAQRTQKALPMAFGGGLTQVSQWC